METTGHGTADETLNASATSDASSDAPSDQADTIQRDTTQLDTQKPDTQKSDTERPADQEPAAQRPLPGTKAAEVITEPLIGPDPKAAAFFDLDNTMIQGASLYYLAKGLYDRKWFSRKAILRALWLQAQFRILGTENPEHIAEAQEASLSFIAGRSVEEIKEAGEEIYEESMAQRIWPGTRSIAQLHLDAGHQVWLVTGAPIEMAGIIAARLGMTGALGTEADVLDGLYTGHLEAGLMHGPAKATAVRALAERHGFDLDRCYAYSDSHNDLPLLSLVGHPCAINPDAKLRQHAAEQDWQIRDYRTSRRAVKAGALGVGSLGAALAGVMAGIAIRRHLKG